MKLYVVLSDETLEQAVKNIDLILISKATNILNIIIRDEELQGVDITGATVNLVIKNKSSDTDGISGASAVLEKEITDFSFPTSGEFDLEIEPDDCEDLVGNYIYEIQIELSDEKVYKLCEGTICFQRNIIGVNS
jgi:hypothetical protein